MVADQAIHPSVYHFDFQFVVAFFDKVGDVQFIRSRPYAAGILSVDLHAGHGHEVVQVDQDVLVGRGFVQFEVGLIGGRTGVIFDLVVGVGRPVGQRFEYDRFLRAAYLVGEIDRPRAFQIGDLGRNREVGCHVGRRSGTRFVLEHDEHAFVRSHFERNGRSALFLLVSGQFAYHAGGRGPQFGLHTGYAEFRRNDDRFVALVAYEINFGIVQRAVSVVYRRAFRNVEVGDAVDRGEGFFHRHAV